MDSGQSYLKDQLVFVDAVDDALGHALSVAVVMLREHGVPDPTYIASAGVIAVLVKVLYTFFIGSGMDKDVAEAKAKAMLKPIADAADDAYWAAKQNQQSQGLKSRIPPVSLN